MGLRPIRKLKGLGCRRGTRLCASELGGVHPAAGYGVDQDARWRGRHPACRRESAFAVLAGLLFYRWVDDSGTGEIVGGRRMAGTSPGDCAELALRPSDPQIGL